MELTPLQQAWQTRMTARRMQIKAQAAYRAAQQQQIWAREQRERLRLRQAMPATHAWIIDLTARLFVARDLDADAPWGREAKERQQRGQEIRAHAG